MKLKNVFVKGVCLISIGIATAISSCTDENRLTLQDTQDITEEAIIDSYFQDMDDMAGVAVGSPSDNDFSGGRTSATVVIEDDRFTCSGIVLTVEPGVTSNAENPNGVLTVDFGDGCKDVRDNIRTGKIFFAYSGWRFKPGSTVTTTTQNYTINGIKLEGTRTLTNVIGSTTEAPKFTVVLVNGKAIFTDATEATRESTITWQWNKVGTIDLKDDYLLIDQSSKASGTTRGGRHYDVSFSKALKFNRFCGGIPVEGVKKYVIEKDKDIVIDYGDGTCDKKISVTVNGITRSLTVN